MEDRQKRWERRRLTCQGRLSYLYNKGLGEKKRATQDEGWNRSFWRVVVNNRLLNIVECKKIRRKKGDMKIVTGSL